MATTLKGKYYTSAEVQQELGLTIEGETDEARRKSKRVADTTLYRLREYIGLDEGPDYYRANDRTILYTAKGLERLKAKYTALSGHRKKMQAVKERKRRKTAIPTE